ncbi:PspC domain-containing protein [Candidatus Cryosericum odellii]|jgi:phage shock protein PspC (stress-responsive transcriptional regulator)|nr:PspC domain-containing protein [Candidatus Cryosericum odellii]HZL83146.1 PspC domain-containing protein [Candidatus Deferrimicrobium sp.]
MKSFDRPDEEAVGVCTKCGKALAREEVVMVDGKIMCGTCAPAQPSAASGEQGPIQDQWQHPQAERSVSSGVGYDSSRRLYRSRRNQVIGGVAGGVAEYFDIDPTIVRIAWALLGMAWGTGILVYLICWLVIPLNPTQ